MSKLGEARKKRVVFTYTGCGWPLAMSSPKTARLHFSVGETKVAFGNEEDEEGGKAHGNV